MPVFRPFSVFAATLVALFLTACGSDEAVKSSISYRLVGIEEARDYFVHDKFNDQMTPLCLDICLQKEGATHEEWTAANLANLRDARPERQALLDSLARIHQAVLDGLGITLPLDGPVPYVDLDFSKFGGAGGCTSGAHVYVNTDRLRRACDRGNVSGVHYLMWHELWHVLSRNNPDLRRQMYELIGFTILPAEIALPAEVKSHVLFNPDVERHDNYATFTIDGQPTECMLLLYAANDKYVPGASINTYLMDDSAFQLLVLDPATHTPLRDAEGRCILHNISEASDFREKMSGGNTDYCDDAEECIADNFAYAIMQNREVPNQEILEKILQILRKR